MVFRFPEEKFGHKATLYSLPGVPFEALGALDEVLQDIKANNSISDIYHKTIMTYGIAESALSKQIEDWENNLPDDMHLAYLPNPLTGVRLRLSIYGGNMKDESARVEKEFCKLKEILSEYIYSEHEDTLQDNIGRLLNKAGKTISAAESCTGGMISHLFTSVPGSSAYFLGSVTSYSNSVKESVLNVPAEIINSHGAVSSECAAAMAEGVRKLTGSDFAVSTTGIAGPTGGSKEKPVGTVWIGVSSELGTETYKIQYNGDRQRNIERSSAYALHLIRKKILKEL
jgi:nicotinamide-nucleotide amidase